MEFIRKGKQEKGITLAILVITVIILLIIAGVSISMITGGGILQKADIAAQGTEIAGEIERMQSYYIKAVGMDKKGKIE